MNKKKVIFYFLRLPEEYGNIEKADKALKEHSSQKLQIGYCMPQPQYKKWIPRWLISFLIKKEKSWHWEDYSGKLF